MKRYIVLLLVALPVLLVFVPALLVYTFSPVDTSANIEVIARQPKTLAAKEQLPVKVYRTEKKVVETIPLEDYIVGVVAAEMPAEFELEALKAQALAARTYIVRRLRENNIEKLPGGAQVLDTVKHQAYYDADERKEKWGSSYEWKNSRIMQAVRETAGVILAYNGKPIDATFFSTSNGFTENADEYWNQSIPYLKSVASPWDTMSPRYREEKRMDAAALEQRLGVKLDAQASTGGTFYTVLERTAGNRIGRIRIGEKEFTGKEIREALGLNSTAFTMRLQGGQVVITTHGYGHGVGMSQWGANGMAKAGKNAEEIVKYFYQGISLENYQKMLN